MVNSMSFTPAEVQAGLLQNLLNYFIEFNKKSEGRFIDSHIYSDGYCIIVEWFEAPYDRSYGGSFQYISEDSLD